ncbi:hypothetical protein [uncultured Bdellovibrio sp.]|uniref:hypothetical protein n=1 Tax=Bdellovibrio sp. HCB-162 TaxID=3394234 RepID=UPI0025EBDAD3|nr:hypothetical protein [uncultured Bdellovibrio sp.]
MRIFSLSFLLVLFSLTTFAADIEPYFEALKQSGANFEPDGAICEQVARLALATQYPDKDFSLASGIEYDAGGMTLGELDVLVINRATQKVVLVTEVKCWKNLKQALDKVVSQRQRFIWNLTKFPQKMHFVSYSELDLKAEQFDAATEYRSISQLGGVKYGFDMELDLTLSEFRALRMKLLKCQAWGECARAAQ